MNEEKFWTIIEKAIEAAGENPDAKLESLRAELERLSPEQILHFARIYDQLDVKAYRWDLWAAAYLIGGGCSDDAFSDFRASLICSGKAAFQNALASADSLGDFECDNPRETFFYEGYQYLPAEIYEEKTGDELPSTGITFPKDPEGTAWKEESPDDLKGICPKLFAKYGP